MTELETQIWNTVHNWCDAQSNEIPDQNRRYLMDEIKAMLLSHDSKHLPNLVKCRNCNEEVEMVISGQFCPKCFCE